MKTHLGTYRPDADGVIFGALPARYSDFRIDLNGLAPEVDDDMCQITFTGTEPLRLFFNDNYEWGWTGTGGGVHASKQTYGFCGYGVVSGALAIQNRPVFPTPGIFVRGNVTNAAGSKFAIIMMWTGGSSAASFSISFTGRMKSGSVNLYGVA